MDRRRFLQALGLTAIAAAAGEAVLDPEFALWKPGAKTILLPPTTVFELGHHQIRVGDVLTIGGYPKPFVVTAAFSSSMVFELRNVPPIITAPTLTKAQAAKAREKFFAPVAGLYDGPDGRWQRRVGRGHRA